MNGSIMGMTRHEISRRLEEIVDFAGVERYIDTPVKRYSSGMTVRLACRRRFLGTGNTGSRRGTCRRRCRIPEESYRQDAGRIERQREDGVVCES